LSLTIPAKGLFQEIASSYLYDKLKEIPMLSTKFGNTRVVFQMITKFYDLISYDKGNTELQEMMKNLHAPSSDSQIELNSVLFNYNCDWDFNEDLFFDNSWRNDLKIVNEDGIPESIESEIEIAARWVEGFRLNSYSINHGLDLTDVLISGYKLLEHIDAYIKRNSSLKIKHKVIVVVILADKKTNSRILSKLKRKIKDGKFLSRIKLNVKSEQDTRLIIYPSDGFDINTLIGAINSWWSL